MNRQKEQYRLLLQDRMTTSVKELTAECALISKTLLERYKLRPIGYDPGVLCVDAVFPDSGPVDIPTWLLKRMMADATPKDTP